MSIDFDTPIERRNTHSAKWDAMETVYGVSSSDGLPMWVADMDFHPPQAVSDALRNRVEHGVHGYFGNSKPFNDALIGWMRRRHDWDVRPDWIINTAGLVNGIGHCVQAFTEPGDDVILFTPVYHAFAKVVNANGRGIVQSHLVQKDGQYHMDLDTLAAQLTGRERMVIWCSPHNPGGRVWSRDELRHLADFCVTHNLVLISDEIHCDLVFSGHKHVTMANAAPHIADRLVTLVATTKTFNIAGAMMGSVIISDPALRAKFQHVYDAISTHVNLYGMLMAEAAYRHGDEWLEALIVYLDENRRIFDAGISAIPGLTSMRLEATYLAWVDFADTGMSIEEVHKRIEKDAKIAANYGDSFGAGGESYMRFNLATPRANVIEAVARLQKAFGDLQ